MLTPDTFLLTDHDAYLFREGTHARLYDRLGCHLREGGAHFGVWAPNARRVSVIGEFNGWRPDEHRLAPRSDGSGIWEIDVAGVARGQAYKYRVESNYGDYWVDKADPFAFYAEVPPRTASRAWSLDYEWGDGAWMAERRARIRLSAQVATLESDPMDWRDFWRHQRRVAATYRVCDPRGFAGLIVTHGITAGILMVLIAPKVGPDA